MRWVTPCEAISARDPTQDEERGAGLRLVEEIEEPVHVALHAGWKARPFLARDPRGERLHLKVILHVDTQREGWRREGVHGRRIGFRWESGKRELGPRKTEGRKT
jgi:hypothetical protein